MFRFLVIEPTHSISNPTFDVRVAYLQLIIFSVLVDILIDSDAFFTDFVNFKIKPTQSLGYANRDMMCVRVFIWMSGRMRMSIYVCNIPQKKDRYAQTNEKIVMSLLKEPHGLISNI
jgi:hypothetical protein